MLGVGIVGWTVRQLRRQIRTQFYQRTALSRDKVVMLQKGEKAKPEDDARPEEAIKDPYLLEFLDLVFPITETHCVITPYALDPIL